MSEIKNEYEGLGVLYLGKKFDVDANKLEDEIGFIWIKRSYYTCCLCWNDRKRKDRPMHGVIRIGSFDFLCCKEEMQKIVSAQYSLLTEQIPY